MPENPATTSFSQKEIFQASLTHRLIKGSFVVLFFAFASTPLGYLSRMLFSRTLSIEMYGLFYAILSFLTLLGSLNNLGFGFGVSYFVPKFIKKNQYQNAWNTYKYNQIIEVITALLISVIIILIAPWLAEHYFKVPEAKIALYLFSIYFVADSFLSSMEKFFTGLEQELYYSSMSFVKIGLVLLFAGLLWFIELTGIYYYAIAMSLAYCTAALLYLFLLHKKNKKLVRKWTWNRRLFKKLLNYALPTLMLSSLGLISSTVDTFFLVGFKDLRAVGIFNVILPLVAISPTFLSPINGLLLPLISKLEDEQNRLKQLIEVLLKVVPFVALYFGLFIFLFPRSIIQTIFGSKWMDIAQGPLMLATLGYILLPFNSYLNTILRGLGLVKENVRITPIISVFKIIANMILIYYFGVYGAVLANILLFLLSSYLVDRVIRKKITFSYPLVFYGWLGIFASTSYFLVWVFGIQAYGLPKLIFSGIMYTVIFGLFGLIIGVIDKKNLYMIRKNVKHFI